jgi:hypothetical protein
LSSGSTKYEKELKTIQDEGDELNKEKVHYVDLEVEWNLKRLVLTYGSACEN